MSNSKATFIKSQLTITIDQLVANLLCTD